MPRLESQTQAPGNGVITVFTSFTLRQSQATDTDTVQANTSGFKALGVNRLRGNHSRQPQPDASQESDNRVWRTCLEEVFEKSAARSDKQSHYKKSCYGWGLIWGLLEQSGSVGMKAFFRAGRSDSWPTSCLVVWEFHDSSYAVSGLSVGSKEWLLTMAWLSPWILGCFSTFLACDLNTQCHNPS